MAVVTIDSPAAAVDQYGRQRLPDEIASVTSSFSDVRTFVVVDTRSASNIFEIPAGASSHERDATLQNLTAAVLQAAEVLPPGAAQAQARSIRARLTEEYGGDVLFVSVSMFAAQQTAAGGTGSGPPLGPERPSVQVKGDLDPPPSVVWGGLWVLLVTTTCIAVTLGVLVGIIVLAVQRWNRRRRTKTWSGDGAATALPEPTPTGMGILGGDPNAWREAARRSRSGSPRPGDRPSSGLGGRPAYVIAGLMLLASAAVAQPVTDLEDRSLAASVGPTQSAEAACRAADFVLVADVSGSTTAREDVERMLESMVKAYEDVCVAVFGDSTRAVAVGSDVEGLRSALRGAPTDGYTRVADAFVWAGALARAAREEGRSPKLAVVSDFVDDDASGAVNAAFLPTLSPPDESQPDTVHVETVSPSTWPWAHPLWIGLASLLVVLVPLAWWAGRHRRIDPGVEVEIAGRTMRLYRGGEPVLVRPERSADGSRGSSIPAVLASVREDGVVQIEPPLPEPTLDDAPREDEASTVRPVY